MLVGTQRIATKTQKGPPHPGIEPRTVAFLLATVFTTVLATEQDAVFLVTCATLAGVKEEFWGGRNPKKGSRVQIEKRIDLIEVPSKFA